MGIIYNAGNERNIIINNAIKLNTSDNIMEQ